MPAAYKGGQMRSCLDNAAYRQCEHCTWQCRVQVDGEPERVQEAKAQEMFDEHLRIAHAGATA